MGVGGQRHNPAALLPGKAWHPLYRGLSGPRAGREWCVKFRPSPEFDPMTVLPPASCYTGYTIPDHFPATEGSYKNIYIFKNWVPMRCAQWNFFSGFSKFEILFAYHPAVPLDTAICLMCIQPSRVLCCNQHSRSNVYSTGLVFKGHRVRYWFLWIFKFQQS